MVTQFAVFKINGSFVNVFNSESDAKKVASLFGSEYFVKDVTGKGYQKQ